MSELIEILNTPIHFWQMVIYVILVDILTLIFKKF